MCFSKPDSINDFFFPFIITVEHCLAVNYFVKYLLACYPKYGLRDYMAAYILSKMPYKIANSNILQIITQIYLEVRSQII